MLNTVGGGCLLGFRIGIRLASSPPPGVRAQALGNIPRADLCLLNYSQALLVQPAPYFFRHYSKPALRGRHPVPAALRNGPLGVAAYTHDDGPRGNNYRPAVVGVVRSDKLSEQLQRHLSGQLRRGTGAQKPQKGVRQVSNVTVNVVPMLGSLLTAMVAPPLSMSRLIM